MNENKTRGVYDSGEPPTTSERASTLKRKPEIILLLFSCICCVVALELVFYIVGERQRTYPAVVYDTEDERTKLVCYDDEFLSTADWDLRRDRPYSRLRYAMNTDDDLSLQGLDPQLVPHAVEVKLNEVGFRDRSLAQLNADPEADVTLVIGDSFGVGQGVRVADRFTQILEAKLNLASAHDHVLANFCMMGFNIKKISETMAEHMRAFPRLRRVIYVFTLNDPVRDVRGQEMSQSIDDFMQLRTNLLSENVDLPVISRSHALRWVLERVARRQISRQTIEWYNYMYTDNAGWRKTMRTLDQMHRQSQQNGCEFILVLWPLLFDLEEYPFRKAHDTIRAYARARGMRFIDLLDLFAGRDEQTYWVHPRDFHPNHLAHKEVAESLFERIEWEVAR